MPTPPEATRHSNLTKLLVLLPLRANSKRTFQCETPCSLKQLGFWIVLISNLFTTFNQNSLLSGCTIKGHSRAKRAITKRKVGMEAESNQRLKAAKTKDIIFAH